jgi:ABC-type lipoprotein export system ATPase subunit
MPPKKKLYIAVMGITGSGKSTFIQVAAGLADAESARIGHELHSCELVHILYDIGF